MQEKGALVYLGLVSSRDQVQQVCPTIYKAAFDSTIFVRFSAQNARYI